jgi:hypothetical protein
MNSLLLGQDTTKYSLKKIIFLSTQTVIYLFSGKNLITLRISMFDHVSASPAILQLMLGQYDWYETRSSVRERKQCSTCSDMSGNLNEIRNITHVRGFVTLFIESSSYILNRRTRGSFTFRPLYCSRQAEPSVLVGPTGIWAGPRSDLNSVAKWKFRCCP